MRIRYWINQSVYDVEHVWLPSLYEAGQHDGSTKLKPEHVYCSDTVLQLWCCSSDMLQGVFFFLQCQAVGEWRRSHMKVLKTSCKSWCNNESLTVTWFVFRVNLSDFSCLGLFKFKGSLYQKKGSLRGLQCLCAYSCGMCASPEPLLPFKASPIPPLTPAFIVSIWLADM